MTSEFRIWNRRAFQKRKPYQFPGRMKNSHYYCPGRGANPPTPRLHNKQGVPHPTRSSIGRHRNDARPSALALDPMTGQMTHTTGQITTMTGQMTATTGQMTTMTGQMTAMTGQIISPNVQLLQTNIVTYNNISLIIRRQICRLLVCVFVFLQRIFAEFEDHFVLS